jgi:hypothetical protein
MAPLPPEDTWKDASTKGKEAKMVFHPFVNTLSAGTCNHKNDDLPDLVEITDDPVALAMKHIFSQFEISDLDIADGLKELLFEKKYDLYSLLHSDAASVAGKLGIEEYVAKMIINSAKRKAIE